MRRLLMLLAACLLIGCTATKTNSDFVIVNHELVAYRGNDAEVTIPDDVTVIKSSAFETSDDYPKDGIRKIIVPGTVKTIESEAFAFCYADIIIFEEGVESIGDSAFLDSYPEELTFPASIKTVGTRILETEEGLPGTKIHVVKGSVIDKAIQEQDPYGHYTLVYDEK